MSTGETVWRSVSGSGRQTVFTYYPGLGVDVDVYDEAGVLESGICLTWEEFREMVGVMQAARRDELFTEGPAG
jgi:hypothetical protein